VPRTQRANGPSVINWPQSRIYDSEAGPCAASVERCASVRPGALARDAQFFRYTHDRREPNEMQCEKSHKC
jgi:hypothetical protein